MRGLNQLKQVRLAVSISHVSRHGVRREATATVRNQGSAVAAMVRLSLLDAHGGERVLPTLYGDNYLWLLPGEARTVTLSWPAAALPSNQAALRVEGYNAQPVSLRL
ncbi:glycoside hydrolase family 2 protein [Streptomyces sp. NPDC056160]|uniref:glycoside hydrolase family 2 protein n=1 Tax=Streptomyces sp. NPDC056160 TaxID=3345731 RepID=UPI0035D82FAA